MRRARAAALALLLALSGCGGGDEAGSATGEAAGGENQLEAVLYFPGPGGRLVPERRMLAAGTRTEDHVRAIVEALLAGPEAPELVAPFPPEVELAGLYLTARGTVYVDLHAAEGAPPPAAGSAGEMQRVYSLVNSITLGVDEARRVVLLWNGIQPSSFAGHLDTSRPLAANRDLVAQ